MSVHFPHDPTALCCPRQCQVCAADEAGDSDEPKGLVEGVVGQLGGVVGNLSPALDRSRDAPHVHMKCERIQYT